MCYEGEPSPPTIVQYHVRPQNSHQARVVVDLAQQYPGPLTIVVYHKGAPVILGVMPCREVHEHLEMTFDPIDFLLEMRVWKASAHH